MRSQRRRVPWWHFTHSLLARNHFIDELRHGHRWRGLDNAPSVEMNIMNGSSSARPCSFAEPAGDCCFSKGDGQVMRRLLSPVTNCCCADEIIR